jgi:streptogrisin C
MADRSMPTRNVMTPRRLTTRLVSAGAALVVAGTLVLTAATAASADDPERDPEGWQAGEEAVFEALERDLGLDRDQAVRLLAAQDGVSDLARDLAATLRSRYGGAWFDDQRLELVVAVLDQDAASVVEAAGARPELVTRSYDDLVAIVEDLNDLVRDDPHALPDALVWGVVEMDNRVEILAREGYPPALDDVVKRYGEAVTIGTTDLEPQLTPLWIDGGHGYGTPYGQCSVGFNLRDRNNNRYFLTAGHCGAVGHQAVRQGATVGPFLESWFPTYDDALVRVDNSFWLIGGWVATHPGFRTVRGHDRSPVGSTVCSSGETTGWTCGRISGHHQSVSFPEGTIYGNTSHTACVEGGDSGGANVSLRGTSTGVYAEGTSVGGMLLFGRCLGRFAGGNSVSWYQPIGGMLAYYHAVYGVELMTF